MRRRIIESSDGSSTLKLEEFDESYHSINGAIEESTHIYINNGLDYLSINSNKKDISILEIGFGTGLNALLTLKYAITHDSPAIIYETTEKYPLTNEEYNQLNHINIASKSTPDAYKAAFGELAREIYTVPWEQYINIGEKFKLIKRECDVTCFSPLGRYDIVFFDAFSPTTQPEMWSKEIFQKLYNSMNSSGILVTYCARGIVKEALRQCGFKVSRLKGAPGKRHMVRATKE